MRFNVDVQRNQSAAGGGAVSILDLGTGDEIRSKPVADRFGGDLGGAISRIVPGALLGEALLRPGYIVANVGRRAVVDHNFAGLDFNQLISYPHTANLLRR